ncbi:TIGR04211 family SH3 domain-containing protein [Desulfobacterales bacterium HSG16]|nr:TIGR04211 family SH3 domain-containing protein [Desulfobacterales bacterium HSG16]
MCAAVTAQAETMYVNDIIKITLRTGPGISRKVIDNILSGQKVNVIGHEGGWAHVTLPNNKKGWVLNRYLTKKRPNELELAALNKKHKELTDKYNKLLEKNRQRNKEHTTLDSEFAQNQKSLEKINKAYDKLKIECADFLTVQSKYEIASQELYEKTKTLEYLEKRVKDLSMKQYLYGAYAGVSILIIGILMGYMFRRKRKSSLY